ncbi:MAG: non-lysosomal glucosylceramidase, partial [Chloroflexota bacterium]|nr:non-lysosomal glucosylceramidase [Chloroflexota bacterium]
DGGLRQWQLFNQANHLAFVPDSFFAIRTSSSPEPGTGDVRILQSEEVLDLPPINTPLVNDDYIPAQQADLVRTFGGVARTTFTGAYPFARLTYEDSSLPLDVSLEAWSPFVPLDSDASELPAVLFAFRLHNPTEDMVHGALGATLKNVVGWDTVSEIMGNLCPLFGGNVNSGRSENGVTSLVLENPSLADDHPGFGQMALSTPDRRARVLPQWRSPADFLSTLTALDLESDAESNIPGASGTPTVWHEGSTATGRFRQPTPSRPGETWNGGVSVPFSLAPGESTGITFVLSWSFPNHYVNYDQPARDFRDELGRSRLWIGNAYAKRFTNAIETAMFVIENRERLEADSRAWSGAVLSSSLPTWLSEFLAAQGALIRSPTVFRTEDGKLYGFEGTQGASTSRSWRGYSGSCPLNCTHVWNYEQALSRLFPDLERTMRETDLDYVQAPEGYIPHRTLLPLFVRQLWNQKIGGPENPALDGMLGTVLKTYREVRQGAGPDWATCYWPNIKRLMSYILSTWDADGDGVLDGEQPNTYDIAFYGTNMFIGGLWLAALRAAEEMARDQGESGLADDLHALFERGRDTYDRLLWNGEYYIQVLGEHDPMEQQYLTGCLADQLLGQWWAHQLGLGHILPEDHVRQTLKSILKHNVRKGFAGYTPEERAFADGDDHGLLVIAWPQGDRPQRPTRYHDEVWTGIEYQVAATCIHEGLVDEGLRIVEAARERYSGVKRNPYNDIECGDHYARAMAGWTVLEALAGYRYDATEAAITLDPANDRESFRGPFVAGTGWGTATVNPDGTGSLAVRFGEVALREISFPSRSGSLTVSLNGVSIQSTCEVDGPLARFTFGSVQTLRVGDVLTVGT